MNKPLRTKKDSLGYRIAIVIAVAVVWLAIWQAVYLIVGKDVLIVSPLSVLLRMLSLFSEASFWQAIGSSMIRILIGYFSALIFGSVLGILTAFSSVLKTFLSPILKIVRATPVASFIILLFVWFSGNEIPMITAFLMLVPVVWQNIYQGITTTDPKLLELAKAFRLSKKVTFRKIYLPSIMSYFIAAATTGIGLAWKAGIAAEVLCSPKFAIGTALYNAKIYLETTDLFAWTTVIILISIIMEYVIVKLIRMVAKKHHL